MAVQTATAINPGQSTTPGLDLGALKARQQAAWSSGNYAVVGTTLQIVGEVLCETLDIRGGSKVLDVAAGNGMASLAAARRWCRVTSTDYVPALLEHGRARAAAKGVEIEFLEADAKNLPFDRDSFDTVLSNFDVLAKSRSGRGRAPARLQAKGPDRSCELNARWFHRTSLQNARKVSAASRRREVAGALGNARR
jgi:SAM-dependent methyltransferase